MPETKSTRINDADDPDRHEKFNRECLAHTVNGNAIIRKLVDAWLLYVKENKHPPRFPVRLVPIDEPKKKR